MVQVNPAKENGQFMKFEEIDTNGDGVISSDEMDITAWDADGGGVSAEEYSKGCDARFAQGPCPNVTKDPVGAARWLSVQVSKLVVDAVIDVAHFVAPNSVTRAFEYSADDIVAADLDNITFEEFKAIVNNDNADRQDFDRIAGKDGKEGMSVQDLIMYQNAHSEVTAIVGTVVEVAVIIAAVAAIYPLIIPTTAVTSTTAVAGLAIGTTTTMTTAPVTLGAVLTIIGGVLGLVGIFGTNRQTETPEPEAEQAAE